jgi:hypothetical protein
MSQAPAALLKQSSDLPFVNLDANFPFIDEGSFRLQLLQVNLEAGLWVIRTVFAPGTTVQKHRATANRT